MRNTFKRIVCILLTFMLLLNIGSVASAKKTDIPPITPKTQSRSSNFSTSYTLTGNGAEDVVAVAFAQLGKTGSSLGYTEEWCADFVGDCAKLAGQKDALPLYGAVDGLATRIVNAGGKEISIANAQKGDICIFNWNNGGGVWDHVEIVYSANGSTISTIGGNTGGGSSLYTRKVATHNPATHVYKIYRPNYKTQELLFLHRQVSNPTAKSTQTMK